MFDRCDYGEVELVRWCAVAAGVDVDAGGTNIVTSIRQTLAYQRRQIIEGVNPNFSRIIGATLHLPAVEPRHPLRAPFGVELDGWRKGGANVRTFELTIFSRRHEKISASNVRTFVRLTSSACAAARGCP